MIRKFLTFLFICFLTVGIAKVKIGEIKELSRSPQTIEKAIDMLLEYIVQNNGLSKEEEVFACSLYSKYTILNNCKEKFSELAELVVKDDIEGFRKKLIVLSEPLDQSFNLVFNIFPQFKKNVERLISDMLNKNYEESKEILKRIKYLWKIPGYSSLFEGKTNKLIYPIMIIALKNPTFLDSDLKEFLHGIFTPSDYVTLETSFVAQFSNLEEIEYFSAMKLSEFIIEGLNRSNKAPSNELIGIYAELSLYFSLERSLYSFAQNFANTPNEILVKKLIELANYLESWENLKIKKSRLKEQMLSMLSELTIRLQFIERVNLRESELQTLKKLVSNINTPEFVTKLSLILSSISVISENNEKKNIEVKKKFNFKRFSRRIWFFSPVIVFLVIMILLPLRLKATFFSKIGFKKLTLYFFRKMLKKNPSSPTLHAELAAMYERMGMIDQARIEYKIAMRLLENLETQTRRRNAHEGSNIPRDERNR